MYLPYFGNHLIYINKTLMQYICIVFLFKLFNTFYFFGSTVTFTILINIIEFPFYELSLTSQP